MAPLISVVTPVFDRPRELRRALLSLSAQTFEDFECVVVDDASVDGPAEVIDSLADRRFRLVTREQNGGCTVARTEGFRNATGTYVTTLDSDNEFFPWALERAAALLSENQEAGCVTGLYVFDDGLRVRVANQQQMVTPDMYCRRQPSLTDCLGVVRREVVQDWLARSRDFHTLDFHLWFGMSLKYTQLYVDEPWGRFHSDAANRVSSSVNPHEYDDLMAFASEYRPVIKSRPCEPLDWFLGDAWFRLRRHGQRQAADEIAGWMRERELRLPSTFADNVRRRVKRRLDRSPTVDLIGP